MEIVFPDLLLSQRKKQAHIAPRRDNGRTKMPRFQLGSAVIGGREAVVVAANDKVFLLDHLLPDSAVSSIQPMLPEWDSWCDRIEAALDGYQGSDSIPLAAITWLPPVRNPHKLICLGANYKAHAAEVSSDPPKLPYAFFKPPSTTLNSSGREVQMLAGAQMNDWEIELAVVIAREARTCPRRTHSSALRVIR
jgi:2-keto-4-pentenoate hydratase/2-oxohepta-3-ene-1,7-dioic acid hydratase in catechol pathway